MLLCILKIKNSSHRLSKSPLTQFAPTDAAFKALGPELLEEHLAQPDKLKKARSKMLINC